MRPKNVLHGLQVEKQIYHIQTEEHLMAQIELQTVISHPVHLNFVHVECCGDL